VEKYGRVGQAADDSIIWCMRIAMCVPKTTNPHSEYVILSAFPLQHRLHETVSLLRHTYSTLCVLLRIAITSDRELKVNIYIIDVFMNISDIIMIYIKLISTPHNYSVAEHKHN
jgi:hypothetical protein